ncbi:MAG: superoxide dismutase [Roseburia sp.]|nr:superoxide dismutase [Roseburia sp.]
MKAETYPFVAKPLPYEYYALAPVLSMETLTYHHDKHYKTYVDNLNAALSDYPELQRMSLKELLIHLDELPAAVRTAVRNNGGGVYNHELYFDSMRAINDQNTGNSSQNSRSVDAQETGGEGRDKQGPTGMNSRYSGDNLYAAEPAGPLADAINRDFGSYKNWKDKMKEAGITKFGSGWAWLLTDADGRLSIVQTANQDVPDLAAYTPVFLVDVWEHAYYLQYQNRRADYLDGWFSLINWRKAQKRYEEREMQNS